MQSWEKEAKERDKLKAELENSVSDEVAGEVWNSAVYDFNPLAYGATPYSKLEEKEKLMIKRIVAVAQKANQKTRHKWKTSLVVNIKKCVNCHGERRRDPKTGKYHYSTESATYCERSDMELIGNA